MVESSTVPRSKDYRKRPEWYCEYQKQWAQRNKARVNERSRGSHRKNREQAIRLYGGSCACCGISTYEFLAIDHINGGGTKERKAKWPNSQSFYRWLKDHYAPETYRILCHNCNSAMGYYGYCPHQRKQTVLTEEVFKALEEVGCT